jgi:hypothetical protein
MSGQIYFIAEIIIIINFHKLSKILALQFLFMINISGIIMDFPYAYMADKEQRIKLFPAEYPKKQQKLNKLFRMFRF